MSKTFATSDPHFGHNNIIKHCNRPYVDGHDMTYKMTANWNNVVGKNDTVWCLGDFCFRGAPAWEYIKNLNGKINFILGNHDGDLIDFFKTNRDSRYQLWDAETEIYVNGQMYVLSHYPMYCWNHSHRGGSVQLFGHCHGNLKEAPPHLLSLDVGVDCWNYTPISFDKIEEIINERRLKHPLPVKI